MKHTVLAMLVAFSLGANASAAETTNESLPSAAEAELIALDDAWIAAEIRHDKKMLERILDEEFLVTFASGKTVDRSSFIDFVMNAEISPFKVVHDVIQMHGDTALVIDLSEDGKSKYTWIAVKRHGQWRVISETFTTVDSH